MSSPATASVDSGAAPGTALSYLRRASAFLAERGVANARLDAEVLLADVLGTDRVGVYLRFDQPLGPGEIDRYRESIRRRGRREPLQYVRGRQEFFSREIRVDPSVLIPRADTEVVVEAALRQARRYQRPRVLDLGTGSGAIAVTVALEVPHAEVVALDASASAIATARANAERLAARVDFREGDFFAPVAGERFDVVVSNPPYVPTAALATLEPEVRDHEPRLALDGGADGLSAYRSIAEGLAAFLAEGAAAVFEIGSGARADVEAIFLARGFALAETAEDLSGIERAITVRAG